MAIYTGKVCEGKLNLWETGSTGSMILDTVPNDAILELETVGGQDGWLKTCYNGKKGYVEAQRIAITSIADVCTVAISSGALNVRKMPSCSANVIYTVANGALLHLLDTASVADWYKISSSSGTGWAMSSFLKMDSNSIKPTVKPANLSVDEYISNLRNFCNSGWTYMSAGYNVKNKAVDCAHYPYLARNNQGGKGCTTEFNGYLSSKGLISDLGGYNGLQRGMEVFQQDEKDSSKKSHMGVYAGKITINGVEYHGVYQSCSSHNTIATVYNNGIAGDSGPNLTEMKIGKWKYWGWSVYIDH